MTTPAELWASALPEGEIGSAKIEIFEVSEEASKWDAIRRSIHGSGRFVPPGIYRRLVVNGELVMSDTPSERRDHAGFVHRASGTVLIHGLGLGCCLQQIMGRAEVEHVRVVELSQDVIDLVGPSMRERYGDRLDIVCADALARKPSNGERYHVIWHDIWPAICTSNLSEITVLKRRWGRRCDWQGAWVEEHLRAAARRDRRDRYRMRW